MCQLASCASPRGAPEAAGTAIGVWSAATALPSITICAPHLRHFCLSLRPATLSSATEYAAPHCSHCTLISTPLRSAALGQARAGSALLPAHRLVAQEPTG